MGSFDGLSKTLNLEIGCGASLCELPIGDTVDATVSLGVDLSIDSLRQARPNSLGWELLCADALALPVADQSCHVVTMNAVLHHLPVAAALAELARVARLDGLIVISDGVLLEADQVDALEAELTAARLPHEPRYGFDVTELTQQLQAVGLVTEQITYDGVATFATPPFVSRAYTSARFTLTARPQRRRAARVAILDESGAVLLFRGGASARSQPEPWWFMPGGKLEPGESFEAAARRELQEETGLQIADLGEPVLQQDIDFQFVDGLLRAHEAYFVVRTERFDIDAEGWTDRERSYVTDHCWWTAKELRASNHAFFPAGIADIIS